MKPSDGNPPPADDAHKPPQQNADPAPAPPAGNGAPTDQQSLLAATLSAAIHATVVQLPPANSTGASSSKADKPALQPAAVPGAAPAQLVSSLFQADAATGNTASASTAGAAQAAQIQSSAPSGAQAGDVTAPVAPPALLAGLQQAVGLPDGQSKLKPAGQSAVGTPAVNAGQNSTPGGAKGAAPPAVPPAPDAAHSPATAPAPATAPVSAAAYSPAPAPAAAPAPTSAYSPAIAPVPAFAPSPAAAASPDSAAHAGDLASLIQTSTSSSTTAATGISAGGNSTVAGQTEAGSGTFPPVVQVGVFISTTAATGSGNVQTSPSTSTSNSDSPSGIAAGPQATAVNVAGNSFAGNATRQSAAPQAVPADAVLATVQVSTPVLPSTPASSTTSALETSRPAQTASTNDAGQGTQPPGSQNPNYLTFGAAPTSLQLHATNFPAGQTASSASLSSLVVDQVSYAVQYSHANGQQMQLHLNPPELGALQVDVSMRDGVLSARIEAQTSTVQQILTANIAQLKDSLTQQGVSFDRIDVHLAGSNAGSGGSSTADRSFGQQQQDGAPAWDQQFAQPEIDNSSLRKPVQVVRDPRIALTSLDIMI